MCVCVCVGGGGGGGGGGDDDGGAIVEGGQLAGVALLREGDTKECSSSLRRARKGKRQRCREREPR